MRARRRTNPLPSPFLSLLISHRAGAAPSHHRREPIPRITPRASQVLSRAAACTRRGTRTPRRHQAALCDHTHAHLHRSDLHRPCRRQAYDRRLRGRQAASLRRVLLHRVLFWLRFRIDRGCSGGSARTRGAPERPFAYSQPASSSSSSSSSSGGGGGGGATATRSLVRMPYCPVPKAVREPLSLPSPGDSPVPCWCWQGQETPSSRTA